MHLDPADTICAIASPPGPASRGVVRISGPSTAKVLDGVLGAPVSSPGRAVTFASSIDVGAPIGRLDVRVLYWPDQRSYTGQPSAEVHLIGAAPLLQATIDRICAAGARQAGPGEFTLRAFLAGRLDLTQAEAVLGVINADSREQLGPALDQLTGGISGPLLDLRMTLIDLLADVEAGLDFVDEDIQFIEDADLARRLAEMSSAIQSIAGRMTDRARSGDVPVVVLCGLPNAGKSRLLNSLAGTEMAIVSDTVGTTRDPVEVELTCDELTMRVVDTAGIEDGDGTESIASGAQELGRQLTHQADLRLWCAAVDLVNAVDLVDAVDADRAGVGQAGGKAVGQAAGKAVGLETRLSIPPATFGSCVRVATKVDLISICEIERLQSAGWIPVSGANGLGVDILVRTVTDLLRTSDNESGVAATAARCRRTLVEAAESLGSAVEVTQAGGGHELVAAELRLAIDAIGQVTGMVYTDDILDSIFSRFCIGK